MSYYDSIKKELEDLLRGFVESAESFNKQMALLGEEKEKIEKMRTGVQQMAKERQVGFPWLAKAYEEYFMLQDKSLIDFLRYKKTPALQASEVVKEYGKIRRETIKDKKIAEYLVEYYENIAPFLLDLKEEVTDIKEEERGFIRDFTEEEQQDEATKFLTKEEYRKLSTIKRNELALERFWRRPKSKWLIGRLYERYVGYLYEEQGYDVEYVGVFKGFEDLGRDLICKNDKEIIVIQCKNWSKFRTIYEKHIFQFFGTVFQYRDENPKKKVRAIFYTSTGLSDLARRFATELNIGLKENFKFNEKYPCIKCNVSRVDGAKIYHLPFDQQYDTTKIEQKRGEFYSASVKEVESAGFRRAFRWQGEKVKN